MAGAEGNLTVLAGDDFLQMYGNQMALARLQILRGGAAVNQLGIGDIAGIGVNAQVRRIHQLQ